MTRIAASNVPMWSDILTANAGPVADVLDGVVEDLQRSAFPPLVADAAGANGGSFVQPLVPTPGILPVLQVTGLTPSGLPIITPRPGAVPAGPSTPRPIGGYDNLGISGALAASALTKTIDCALNLPRSGQYCGQ